MIMLDWLIFAHDPDLNDADQAALSLWMRNCDPSSMGPFEGGKWSDLSPKMQAIVMREVAELQAEARANRAARAAGRNEGSDMSDEEAYWSVLNTFGLDCPHPRLAPMVRNGRTYRDSMECPTCHVIIVPARRP